MTTSANKNCVPSRKRSAASAARQATDDEITVLMTAPGYSASKRIVKKGRVTTKVDFNAGFKFNLLKPVEVDGIESLHNALTAIEAFPNMLVIRGAPTDPGKVGDWVRRLGDGSERSQFQTPERGRRWVLIDFDKITMPKGLSLKKNPVAVCDWLISLLPPEFHDVSYHWQISSSAGVFNTSTVSIHTWFWLARPIPDRDLKAWANHVNGFVGYKLVDPALYQHVQAHYTAAPIFEGMPDPFPVRSGLVEKPGLSVDLVLPKKKVPLARSTCAAKSAPSTATGFEAKLALIGDHAGGEGFHNPIVAAVASYVSEHGRDGTDDELLYDLVRQRVLQADASHHVAGYVEHMASREHIMPAIESAIQKFGTKRKFYSDCPAHYASDTITVAEAMQGLEDLAKLIR